MEKEPLHHIERSRLPWHHEPMTECGLDPGRVPIWTREEAVAQARKLGRQRFSLFCCMTCAGTAQRHRTWDEDPASCMMRFASHNTRMWGGSEESPTRFAAELRAIAALIEAHRAEFDETVEGLLNTSSLDAARVAKRASNAWRKNARRT